MTLFVCVLVLCFFQSLTQLSPDDGQSWSKLVVNNKIKIQVFISISNYLVRRSIPALELGSKNVMMYFCLWEKKKPDKFF